MTNVVTKNTDRHILSCLLATKIFIDLTFRNMNFEFFQNENAYVKMIQYICDNNCILSDEVWETISLSNDIKSIPAEWYDVDITPYLTHTKNILNDKTVSIDTHREFLIELFLIIMFTYNCKQSKDFYHINGLSDNDIIDMLKKSFVIEYISIEESKEYFNKFKTIVTPILQ